MGFFDHSHNRTSNKTHFSEASGTVQNVLAVGLQIAQEQRCITATHRRRYEAADYVAVEQRSVPQYTVHTSVL